MSRKGSALPLSASTKVGLVILDAIMVVLSVWIGWEADRKMPTTMTAQNMGETLGNEFGIAFARFFAPFVWIVAAICVVVTVALLAADRHTRVKIADANRRIRGSVESGEGLSPKEFLKRRQALASNGDFTGVYVIHNVTRDEYYVGQSVHVIRRVTQHLTGHGNGDVYADYKNGDEFTINVLALTGSGYDSLDALERDTIRAYDAYNKGYNRTRGNRN